MMIEQAKAASRLLGVKIGHEEIPVSHLFYADDVIFIGEWSSENVQNIVLLLRCFFLVSGLKINLLKCKLMGVGMLMTEIQRMADYIGCEAATIPFVYLGLPVGANMARVDQWEEVVNKFKKHLATWKAKILSVGGRLTLLKSVLGSIAIYYMSIFKTPISIINTLESLRNKFFLGADLNEKKMTWVKWKQVMASKKDGGLGVGSLYGFNRALLYKWKWRFITSPNSLWVTIIKSIFGRDGGLCDNRPRGSSCSTWSNIIKSNFELEEKNVSLDAFVKKKVGDGNDTRFWEDKWCGDFILKDKFNRIFRLDLVDFPNVASRISLTNGASWLRRDPRGGVELQQWEALISLIASVSLSPQKDRWVWTGDGTGIFSVASARCWIDKSTLITSQIPTRWVKEVPIKVNVCIWKVLLDKLPTRVNLNIRGLNVESTRCDICDNGDETISHVVFSCQIAVDIWSQIARWWDLDIPIVHSVGELFEWLDNLVLSSSCKKAFTVVIITTIWSIWRFRNDWIFGDKKPKKAFLFDFVVSQAFLWMSNRSRKLNANWVGYLQNPSLALNSL